MHPEYLSIKDFTYDLPDEKIAFHPLAKRDDSKLLIYKRGRLDCGFYRNISDYIPAGSLVLMNNTRVVEARLLFTKDTGGIIEVFCLEPHEKYADITSGMKQSGSVTWLCLIGGASKWKNGQVLNLMFHTGTTQHTIEARFIEKRADCFVIDLTWDASLSFAEVLHYAGHIPLPPYIKRVDEPGDKNRYQTVFAMHDGSVAAPTAGLHFTNEVLKSLGDKHISKAFITLHVGAGTFKPVIAENMLEHEMHAEFFEVDESVIMQLLKQQGDHVIAVGTTSLRTLESLYWMGCKLVSDATAFDNEMPCILQWEVYNAKEIIDPAVALEAVLAYLQRNKINKITGKTQIIIAPGYRFKIVSGLVTNFHQPASTLLLLVAAFIGDDWRNVYNYALNNDFRFLSYGDGCLLWRND